MDRLLLGSQAPLHGHWNQQKKMARWLAVVVCLNTHRDVVVGEPPCSRQALAADQSGPPKSPAATNTYFRFSHALFLVLPTFPSINRFYPAAVVTLTYACRFLAVGNENFLFFEQATLN